VQRGVDGLRFDFFVDQVEEPIVGHVGRAVAIDAQPGVEACVKAQPPRQVLVLKRRVPEDLGVGFKLDKGPVLFAGRLALLLLDQLAAFEDRLGVAPSRKLLATKRAERR